MKGKCGIAMVTWILVIVGAVNWGLVGLGGFFGSNWNLVNLIFGNWSWLEGVVYILVGVAGVMSIFSCKCSKCNSCEVKQAPTQQM
ncbi:DUF378 domain-containing protein [Candidatus Campbellbacteria bacterium]|nr:MAG: DUF378 domain-containing protein [Candidatus Campbellbacteria bacterium]